MDNLLQKHPKHSTTRTEVQKHSTTRTEVQKFSKCPTRGLQKHSTLARLDYEELGGLSDPRQQDCPRARNILE